MRSHQHRGHHSDDEQRIEGCYTPRPTFEYLALIRIERCPHRHAAGCTALAGATDCWRRRGIVIASLGQFQAWQPRGFRATIATQNKDAFREIRALTV